MVFLKKKNHFPIILEARILKLRCQQGHPFSKGSWAEPFLASSSLWHFLACDNIARTSASAFPRPPLLCLHVQSLSPLSYEDTGDVDLTLIQSGLSHLGYVGGNPLPNKVPFTGTTV